MSVRNGEENTHENRPKSKFATLAPYIAEIEVNFIIDHRGGKRLEKKARDRRRILTKVHRNRSELKIAVSLRYTRMSSLKIRKLLTLL